MKKITLVLISLLILSCSNYSDKYDDLFKSLIISERKNYKNLTLIKNNIKDPKVIYIIDSIQKEKEKEAYQIDGYLLNTKEFYKSKKSLKYYIDSLLSK